MALPYKLIQKRNPQDPEGPRKWYATPKSASPQSEKDMVKDATEFTTLSAAEFRAALEHLAIDGFDPVYGARPLKRFIQRTVETLIAKTILSSDLLPGTVLVVDVENGELKVTYRLPLRNV